MEEPRYVVAGRTYGGGDTALQEALVRIYETSDRPRCMCMPGGVEMYVAKHAEYVIKRMPGTGHLHHIACHSFEPEAGTSGLGELLGEAIIESGVEQVEIRTDFPLGRVAGKPLVRGMSVEDPPSVNAPRRRMSLRAVLHFLYGRAGFNRWYPAMEGRRTQAVFCKYLTAAAQGVMLKGCMLEERLYVPEQFRVAESEGIAERRRRKLAILISPESDVRFKMAIVIGQLTGAEATSHGRRLTIKHMPDVPLYMDTKAWERAARAYRLTLQAVDGDVEPKPRVLMAALIYAKREHIYQVDSLTLMLVSDQWIPLDGLYELPLAEALQRQGRAFIKPLKYDAKTAAGFPNALLLDAGPKPVPLHVVSPFMEATDRAVKERAVRCLGTGAWVWRTDQVMPGFPNAQATNQSGAYFPG